MRSFRKQQRVRLGAWQGAGLGTRAEEAPREDVQSELQHDHPSASSWFTARLHVGASSKSQKSGKLTDQPLQETGWTSKRLRVFHLRATCEAPNLLLVFIYRAAHDG